MKDIRRADTHRRSPAPVIKKTSTGVEPSIRRKTDDSRIKKDITSASTIHKCNIPALLVCVVMILLIISELVLKNANIGKQNSYIALVIVQFLVFLLPCAFFVSLKNNKFNGGLSYYNFRPFSPKLLGFTAFSLAVMIFGNMAIKYLGYIFFGFVNASTVIYADDNLIALLMATVILPAITEEILLRGIVFTEYEQNNTGALGAIIGSAFLFAFIHFDPKGFISYLFAGVILATALHVTRSLFVPIIIHLMNNSICLFTDTFLKRVSKESISSFFVFFMLVVLFLVALFFWLESLEWISNEKAARLVRKQNSIESINTGKLIPSKTKIREIIRSVLFAPMFIVVIIIYLFKIVFIK